MALLGWDRETSPYHSGEQELQDRLGRKERQEAMARNIHRPFMPQQHRDFFEQLPLFIAGSVDPDGWPWVSMLFGRPGFVSTPDDRSLSINAGEIDGDPFFQNAKTDAPLGFLGIELPTRRRNRVNGVVRNTSDEILVNVAQSYGNCPQYIHTRDMDFTRDPQQKFTPQTDRFDQLSKDVSDLIASADVFYVASHNKADDPMDTGGVDASHRGGKPGFIKVEGNTLTIPDYVGNFAFNTLGNFLINPKAGLLFIDFETGDLVQLTGTVELQWDIEGDTQAFRGAERAWRFHLDHGHILRKASPMRWKTGEPSPNVALTGDWEEARKLREADLNRKAWRKARVAKIVDESSVIRSFYLEAYHGETWLPFKPGQFLTLRVTPEGNDAPLTRTYTISSPPSDPQYRISVKREGVVSRYLHDAIEVGSEIEIQAPQGQFWMDTEDRRPAVLIAAGVGITPMMSMIRQTVIDGFTRRHQRSLTVFHAAQTIEQRAFAKEISALQSQGQDVLRYISLIENAEISDVPGEDFHVEGRLSPELLQQVLPLADYDFYLCGPRGFMQAAYDMLIALGVDDAKIFAEAFGPASLVRKITTKDQAPAFESVTDAVVHFAKSQVEQVWSEEEGTLLDFAEAHGLTPNFGCRGGSCGSCATKLFSGKTGYVTQPSFSTEEGEVLICCAVPAKSDDPIDLDL